MLRLFVEKDFESQKEEKERKQEKQKKKESIKIMIYVENINQRWNIL